MPVPTSVCCLLHRSRWSSSSSSWTPGSPSPCWSPAPSCSPCRRRTWYTTHHCLCLTIIQWNLRTLDMLGTSVLSIIHIRRLSLLRKFSNIHAYSCWQGARCLSIVGRLSALQSVHYRRFHCIGHQPCGCWCVLVLGISLPQSPTPSFAHFFMSFRE